MRKISIVTLVLVVTFGGVTWLSGSTSVALAADPYEKIENASVEPQFLPAVGAFATAAARAAAPHVAKVVAEAGKAALNAAAAAYGAYVGTKAAQATIGNQEVVAVTIDLPEEIFD
ncbi:putative ABC-type bacteriocin/lantibiotic exporters, contain an N-terminal double-glycine peptidase domain [[Clostridium] ultunense Esp]|nr:putative ABC-type bacteriocin/lantibiotic exporters, contain an N-terminal double-glycine peptidase domain [[Clostridium] ultunense Esp]